MHKFKNSLMTLGGLLALIGVIAILTPFKGYGQQAPEAVSNVKVVNTAAAPVISKIVNATTSPANVRGVESIAPSVLKTFNVSMPGIAGVSAKYVVPSGKRLVIEHVSVSGLLPGVGQRFTTFELRILNSSDTRIGFHHLPTPDPQSNSFDNTLTKVSQPLRMYVDAGFKVDFVAARDDGGGTGTVEFSFSGYLINTQ